MNALFDAPKPERNKAQLGFLNEITRRFMVKWCDYYLTYGEMPKDDGSGKGKEYFEFAIQKKWISKKGDKILSAGWNTAAAFLRR